MQLTILGSGVCVPDGRRYQSGYLLETGANRLLFDLGAGVLQRLAESGADYLEIDAICLSHLHCDHSCDLVPFLFGSNYHPTRRREKPLTLIGPPGTEEWLGRLQHAWHDWIEARDFGLQIHEIGKEPLSLGNDRLCALPVAHSRGAVGYRLQDSEGHVFAYSGDSGNCDALVELGRDADLFLLECAFPDQATESHLDARSAGRIAVAAGCRRLLLTHVYPGYEDSPWLDLVRTNYPGPVTWVQDLERYSI